jgi:hypothetical protein
VRFGLTLEAIEAVEIFLPNLRVQEQIAGVLDSEDLAIEALVKSVELLQAQKRGVIQRLLDEIYAPSDPVDISNLADEQAANNGRPHPAEVNGR